MATSYDWDPARGSEALAAFSGASAGQVGLVGRDLADGLMSTLVSAEILAAKAGAVPLVTASDGSVGVVAIGAARDHLANVSEGVRTLYLAAQGITRRAGQGAIERRTSTPLIFDFDAAPKGVVFPVAAIIALAVVGVAAVIAGAVYLTKRTEIEVEGQNLRQASRIAGVLQLVHEGKLSPDQAVAEFKGEADAEAEGRKGSPWPIIALGAGAVGAGLLWWKTRRA